MWDESVIFELSTKHGKEQKYEQSLSGNEKGEQANSLRKRTIKMDSKKVDDQVTGFDDSSKTTQDKKIEIEKLELVRVEIEMSKETLMK